MNASSSSVSLRRDGGIVTPNVVLLGMLFVCVLVLSNILSCKLIELKLSAIPFLGAFLNFSVHPDCGIILFPLTYFIGDLLTEVYGFRISRMVIWSGLLACLFAAFVLQIAIRLPASPYWPGQSAYQDTLGASGIIFMASCAAYLVGESSNAIILARMKQILQGRKLYLRALISTFCGNILDTCIFCFIVFHSSLPLEEIVKNIVLQISLKMVFEFVCLPFTYWISAFLKRKDLCDAYDFQWSQLNPLEAFKRRFT